MCYFIDANIGFYLIRSKQKGEKKLTSLTFCLERFLGGFSGGPDILDFPDSLDIPGSYRSISNFGMLICEK